MSSTKCELASLLAANGLTLVLHNLPAGDWAAGERGIACHPDRVAEFRYGRRTGDRLRHCAPLSEGQLPCGHPARRRRRRCGARHADREPAATPRANSQAAGIGLLLEPVNTRDIPGFFVDRTRPALDIIAATGSSNIKLQYDIYHAQVMEGDLARTIETEFDRIGHIQLADNPGRHEPGTGEINYPFLFRRIDELGYRGWIGCEYKPATTTTAGLSWFAPYQPKRQARQAAQSHSS